MKKKLLFLMALFLLWGCVSKENITKRQLKEDVTLTFFYIETCPQCKEFKKEAIPYLEETFGEQLTIEQYDLDADETEEIYDHIIDSLAFFDEEYYGQGPMIVLNGYFAILGYTLGDESYLADDIVAAVNHQPLSDELSARYLFKEYQ